MLNPSDYGIFALISSLAAVGRAMATGWSVYLVPAYYPTAAAQEKKGMVSSFFAVACMLSLFFTLLMFALWPLLTRHSGLFASISQTGVALSFCGIILSAPWNVAVNVITLEKKASLYAVSTIGQALISAVTVVFSLYVLRLGPLSLFVAEFVGNAALGLAAVAALRPNLGFSIQRVWLLKTLRLGLETTVSELFANMQPFIERYFLSLWTGWHDVGIYTHSQQYRVMIKSTTRAAAMSVWPVTLEEARNPRSNFEKTRSLWMLAHVAVTLAGLAFVAVGDLIIGLMTHGKFTPAYKLVALWFVYLLIFFSCRAQMGLLYAHYQGSYFPRLVILTVVLGIVMLPFGIPLIGAYGAVLALIAQELVYRVCLFKRARQYGQAPFHDHVAVAGSCFIVLALAAVHWAGLGFAPRLLLCGVLMSAAVFAGRRALGYLRGYIQAAYFMAPATGGVKNIKIDKESV